MRWATTSSSATVTWTDVSNSTNTTTSSLVWPAAPAAPMRRGKKKEPAPASSRRFLREGDCVRVTSDSILKGRVGTVRGFFETDGRRVAFVGWPQGGWTTVSEGDLRKVEG